MTKKSKDLKKGDIFKTEYGIEGNWIIVQMIEDTKPDKKYPKVYEHRVIYYKNATQVPFSMFSSDGHEEVEIVETS